MSVGLLAHVGRHCRIGEGTRVHGGAYLGCDVEVGDHCFIYPGVTIIDRCSIGNRVIIHSGTVVGSDGFGFAQDEKGRHVKIPQTGIVRIDDDVEIGANCTIDRAAFGRTWIQRGVKIDNLVQIAHNVVIGEYSILIAQVGVSGSTKSDWSYRMPALANSGTAAATKPMNLQWTKLSGSTPPVGSSKKTIFG